MPPVGPPYSMLLNVFGQALGVADGLCEVCDVPHVRPYTVTSRTCTRTRL